MASCKAYIVDPTLIMDSHPRGKGYFAGKVSHAKTVSEMRADAFARSLTPIGASLNVSIGLGDPTVDRSAFFVKHVVSLKTLLDDHFRPGRGGGGLPLRMSVVKIDTDGSEYDLANELRQLCEVGWLHIDQLLMELHLPSPPNKRGRPLSAMHNLFMAATSCGLMLHHKERNGWGCNGRTCVEYSWVSLMHARRVHLSMFGKGMLKARAVSVGSRA